MAIDQRGQVTTTGMMNKSGMNLQVPNMSNLVPPKQEVKQPVQVPTQPVDNTPRELGIVENIQRNITAEDMTVLAPVLSPSVKSVLAKIIPEITPLLEGIGTDEETVPVKVSIFTSLPGDIQDFIIQSSTNEMDTNNVPLDTPPDATGMMARKESEIPETPEAGIDYDQIDGVEPDIDIA
ncbi:MAG: hypothetical protein H8D84_00870 [Proteobacteria bacterium]|nr:hypothetical protein [Pseudomonadota bacterium]